MPAFLKSRSRWWWVILVVLLNAGTALVATKLAMPFYLDSWGTSLGVLGGGLTVGLAGGVLYNVLAALVTRDAIAVVWALNSALVAVLTWIWWRAGWVNLARPFHLVGAGVLTGVINASLSMLISTVLFQNVPVPPNTTAFHQMMQTALGSSTPALLVELLLIEITDKTVSLITAASLLVLLPVHGARPHSHPTH